jgi:hypothetical protein
MACSRNQAQPWTSSCENRRPGRPRRPVYLLVSESARFAFGVRFEVAAVRAGLLVRNFSFKTCPSGRMAVSASVECTGPPVGSGYFSSAVGVEIELKVSVCM